MSDDKDFAEHGLLDESVERLLRSTAMWDEPSDSVGISLDVLIAQTGPKTPIRAWILTGVAAAVVVIALLASTGDTPDWTLEVVAGPTGEASGEVRGFNESTGTRLLLDIRDLPSADAGTFYEVWWVGPTGEAVSAGSFLKPDTIEMWVGVRRSEYPDMLITVEASDGNPAPSGVVVARSES